jgi:hypothetical protein
VFSDGRDPGREGAGPAGGRATDGVWATGGPSGNSGGDSGTGAPTPGSDPDAPASSADNARPRTCVV